MVLLQLFLISLIPISVSIGIRALDKYTRFNNFSSKAKIIIFGIVFGIISILGTIFGVKTESGAIINIRDTAPIIAGLFFGGPSGIIAGFIGGIYRFIAVYIPETSFFHAGAYTQIACSLSTIAAGFFTAGIRKWIFNNHHGKWYYGFALGVLCEDFHMLMVFFTHMDDVKTAYDTVNNCALPMILVTAIAVSLSEIGVAILSKEKLIDRSKPIKVSSKIQAGLAISLFVAYCAVSGFTSFALRNIAKKNTKRLLNTNVEDVIEDVDQTIDRLIEDTCTDAQTYINKTIEYNVDTNYIIDYVCTHYNISEFSLINYNNEIVASSNKDIIGFNMTSNVQSNEFTSLLGSDENSIFIQEYQTSGINSDVKMKYAGFKISGNYNYAYAQIGYNTEDYRKLISKEVAHAVENRHVGTDGYVIVADESGSILTSGNIKIDNIVDITLDEMEEKVIDGNEVFCYAVYKNDFYVIAVADKVESELDTNITFLAITLTEVFVFIIMYCLIYIGTKKFIVDKIENINNSLSDICEGNLDVKLNDTSSLEFKALSDGINKTVDTLKSYIDKEAKKMENELNFAKSIQHSALPSTFPPFPNIHEFDIYATMDTAKEVGGDFYDFYLIDDKHIALQIADVSGKGVPAAMFMMQAKTIIKSLVETGLDIDFAITEANKKLCEGNEAQMFVTSWLGVIDIETGVCQYVNSGHNPPLVKHGDNSFEYLRGKCGFVLAGMDTVRYRKQEIILAPGDQLFLYTDGVTEATNSEQKLYGEDRLLNCVNRVALLDASNICEAVKEDVDKFVGDADQFDDITMLSFKFHGNRNIKSIDVDAVIPNVNVVTDFINEFLEENDCPMKVSMQIDVAIDEVFSNICFYAYPKDMVGKIKMTIEKTLDDTMVVLTFEDYGIPYNPLLREDPDVTLKAEERDIGGLGIYMVKKTMDDMKYENINGRNILILKKKL